jgi:hypothetical protein
MTRLWAAGEPVTVTLNTAGRPTHLAWHGQRHTIAHIQQQWEVDTDWWDTRGRVWRVYFAAITADGIFCVFYQDRLTEAWQLSKLYD